MNITSFNFINASNKINKANIKNNAKLTFKGQYDTFEKSMSVKGSETEAKIYTTNVDYAALNQIREFCNHPAFKDAPIRIMPDVHAGKNSVVGFSAPVVNGKVIPNVIGGDIGCGVLCVKFDTNNQDIDFEKLDDVIKTYVSSRQKSVPVSKKIVPHTFEKEVEDLCKHKYKQSSEQVMNSLGTLGGGNHFIEINKDSKGNAYLVIHTGSRKFGKEVNQHFQNIAREQNPYRNIELSYLTGSEAKEYLEDMQLAAKFSQYNRKIIANEIMRRMGWSEIESFESIHNYISQDGITRKGAICADEGKKVLIPLNMRDGSLLGTGKGNKEWNNTAPHGSGRQYKRSAVAELFSYNEYKDAMKGIYSSCVTPSHIDE